MQRREKHVKQFLFVHLAILLTWISAPHQAFAQIGRPMPGASSGSELPPPDASIDPNLVNRQSTRDPLISPTSTENASPPPPTGLPAEFRTKLGDYVELDDSIKNDVYGTIDYPNADLKDIVKAISKLANKNFILDSKINNRKITIISPQPVTKQEAYNAFLSSLYMNGFTLVSMGRFLKIIEAKDAIQSNIRVFMGEFVPASEEVVTVLYPLKYLNADEIQRFLTDLVPRNGRISSYPNTNTLVMTDTGMNLRRIVAILKSIDVPGHEDQLENIQIRYASAKGVAALIGEILEAQSGTRRSTGPARNQAQKTRGGGIITKIVPDERTNSLVVLANGRGVQELKNLVAKLDTPDAAGGGNIHIYFCKNAVAEELAGTINNLISGSRQTPTSGAGGRPIPTLPPASGRSRNRSDIISQGVRFEGNLKIAFDKPSNSLVIVASGSDFAALKSVLKKLDVPRRQVYVEGTIMEISINDNREFNAGFLTPAGAFIPSTATPTLAAIASNPAALTGAVTMFQAGKTVDVTLPSGKTTSLRSVTGLIRAIQEANQGNILHQPQILTSDNQDAEIKVTNKVPVNTGAITNPTSGAITASVGREEITISLKLTPQIGRDNDLVKLKVEQQVDDFNSETSTKLTGQIETTTRKATTTVVARDGDTIVVGGLQKNLSSDSRSKFPLIGDIPVIGWLFKGSTSSVKKSNLVLFLTPYIINEYSDLIRLTRNKLEGREKLGLTQYDPKDRFLNDLEKFKAQNDRNLEKPEPKGWGFKPVDSSDGVYDNSEDENPEEQTPGPTKSGSVKSPTAGAYVQALSGSEEEEAKKKSSQANGNTNDFYPDNGVEPEGDMLVPDSDASAGAR